MIYDTNYIVQHIRQRIEMSSRVVIPIVVAGELQAFALKSEWGEGRKKLLADILYKFPIADLNMEIVEIYAQIDVYSQGKLENKRLPSILTLNYLLPIMILTIWFLLV
jgi:tRNA(fMet)-specific endonuclease VapC